MACPYSGTVGTRQCRVRACHIRAIGYASNNSGIVEFDFLTGLEQELVAFPPPQELWERLHAQEWT